MYLQTPILSSRCLFLLIYDTINTLKEGVPMFLEKVSFSVEGMKCEKCVKRVKECLKKMKNIKKVQVSLENKEVTIFFNKKKDISLEEIKKSIEELGYTYEGTI